MNYCGIVNFPHERTRVTFPWVWWDGAFSDEEIARLLEYFDANELEMAVTLGGSNEKVRKSKIRFHAWSEELNWLFQRLNEAIATINNRWYGFDLNGYTAIQFTEYRHEAAGKYDWHMDLCMGDSHLPDDMIEPRKLSFVLLLGEPGVDFEGGEFQVNMGNEADAHTVELKKGRIVAFPSWMIHRVKPVTKGVRRSLVVWVTGPKFV